MKIFKKLALLALISLLPSCADEKPFLSGYIKRASTGLMTPCDPYNLDQIRTCVVYSTAFGKGLAIYNASAEEMVLSPLGYFPLRVKVGPTTDVLVRVASDNPKFPYILGLDSTTKSLYPVRTFPSADGKQSFGAPVAQKVQNAPFRMAAFESVDDVYALLLNDKSIDVVALDKNTGALKGKTLPTPLGEKLSHIQIDGKGKNAYISDEGETKMYVIDLSDVANKMATDTALDSKESDIGMKVDAIHLSVRDFGDGGEKPYLAALEASGKKLVLFEAEGNAVNKKAEADLEETPLSLYFPDKSSEPCCGGKKDWLQVATLKGKILYFAISDKAAKLSLEKTIDLTSRQVLGVSRIHIAAMVGGRVEEDPSLKRESVCRNMRKVFLVSSYASQEQETEGQSYSCEGGDSASWLGDDDVSRSRP